jgi:UPF0176 protein
MLAESGTTRDLPDLPYLNVAFYHFKSLAPVKDDLISLRDELKSLARSLDLRGTVLLAPEGFNCFFAGPPEDVKKLKSAIFQATGASEPNVPVKESWSGKKPYTRMLVKVKDEIIAWGQVGFDPASFMAPRLSR